MNIVNVVNVFRTLTKYQVLHPEPVTTKENGAGYALTGNPDHPRAVRNLRKRKAGGVVNMLRWNAFL